MKLNELLTNPLSTFAVFLVTLILFHCLIPVVGRNKKQWWRCVDYLWLSMTLLGLIGLVASVRMRAAELWLPEAQKAVVNAIDLARLNATSHANWWSTYDLTRVADVQTKERLAVSALGYAQVFSRCASELTRPVELKPWVEARKHVFELLQAGSQELGPMVSSDASNFLLVVAWIENAHAALVKRQEEASRQFYEEIVFVFSPWIVAFALGIRMTRVTAELLDYA